MEARRPHERHGSDEGLREALDGRGGGVEPALGHHFSRDERPSNRLDQESYSSEGHMEDSCESCGAARSTSGSSGHYTCACKPAVPDYARLPEQTQKPPEESDDAIFVRNLATRVIARAFDDAAGIIEGNERRKGHSLALMVDGWKWLYKGSENRKKWFRWAGLREPQPNILQAQVDEWARLRISSDPRRRTNINLNFQAITESVQEIGDDDELGMANGND